MYLLPTLLLLNTWHYAHSTHQAAMSSIAHFLPKKQGDPRTDQFVSKVENGILFYWMTALIVQPVEMLAHWQSQIRPSWSKQFWNLSTFILFFVTSLLYLFFVSIHLCHSLLHLVFCVDPSVLYLAVWFWPAAARLLALMMHTITLSAVVRWCQNDPPVISHPNFPIFCTILSSPGGALVQLAGWRQMAVWWWWLCYNVIWLPRAALHTYT